MSTPRQMPESNPSMAKPTREDPTSEEIFNDENLSGRNSEVFSNASSPTDNSVDEKHYEGPEAKEWEHQKPEQSDSVAKLLEGLITQGAGRPVASPPSSKLALNHGAAHESSGPYANFFQSFTENAAALPKPTEPHQSGTQHDEQTSPSLNALISLAQPAQGHSSELPMPQTPWDTTFPPEPAAAEKKNFLTPSINQSPLPDRAISKTQAEPECNAYHEGAPTRIEPSENLKAEHRAGPSLGARLQVIGGNNRGQEFILKLADNSIGRGVDNDIILADIAVSRKHLIVCFEDHQFILRDLGSGNGTLLNGQKVTTQVLKNDDQIELGNTLLRFINPLLSIAPVSNLPSLNIGSLNVGPNREPSFMPAALQQPDAMAHLAQSFYVNRYTQENILSKKGHYGIKRPLIIFVIGAVSFWITTIGVGSFAVIKKVRQQSIIQEQQLQEEKIAGEFHQGVFAFNQRHWEEAQSHFAKVMALSPTHTFISSYVGKIQSEVMAGKALANARKNYADGQYQTARMMLKQVPTDSSYYPEAKEIFRKTDEVQITKLLEQAHILKAAGDGAQALKKVKEAQQIAPNSTVIAGLIDELSASVNQKTPASMKKKLEGTEGTVKIQSSTQNPSHRQVEKSGTKTTGSAPKKTGLVLGALNHYKNRDWKAADQTMQRYAESLAGKMKAAAQQMAEAMKAVGQNWMKAEQIKDPGQSLKYYQQALMQDAKVEQGIHQKSLKEKIVQTAKVQANNALGQAKYAEAFAAAKVAKNYAKNDSVINNIFLALEKKAQDILKQGTGVQKTDIQKARRLWQNILRMVPPTSTTYQKAYSLLNNFGVPRRDEDEE